jgi:tRNA U34 5-methylaminomethyl-2-thiouridine-forming methyltransferase MnmC
MATKDISDVMVCAAVKQWRAGEMLADELLEDWTKQPPKVCYYALERALRRGLIECGVSLRTSWLTDAGKQLLELQVSE